MTLQHAILELDADVDGDGSLETGVFKMVGNLEVQTNLVNNQLVGGEGQLLNAVVSGLLQDGATKRKGFYFDLGAGQHDIEINFTGWEGAVDGDGNAVQWGDTGNGGTVGDATGEDPTIQMQCLAEYLRVGEFDSRAEHARFRFGEYSDGTYADSAGRYDDYLHVTVVRAVANRVADDPIAYDGSIYLTEAESAKNPLDAKRRPDR